MPYQRLQHHDPLKWKKKFKMLFQREKIIDFGLAHKTQIDLRKLEFNPSQQVVKPLKQLGQEILANPKFWILYLTLAKPGSTQLWNSLDDLTIYGVENSYDNRIMMAEFLPEDQDQEEVQADNFLLAKWQEHIQNIATSPDLKSMTSAKILETVSQQKEPQPEQDQDMIIKEYMQEAGSPESESNQEPVVSSLAHFADQ